MEKPEEILAVLEGGSAVSLAQELIDLRKVNRSGMKILMAGRLMRFMLQRYASTTASLKRQNKCLHNRIADLKDDIVCVEVSVNENYGCKFIFSCRFRHLVPGI